jgi:hypothetical protein
MYAAMIKQAMMGMGVKDPAVLGMVDRIAAIGFAGFQANRLEEGPISIPKVGETLLVSGRNATDSYRLILICEKKN